MKWKRIKWKEGIKNFISFPIVFHLKASFEGTKNELEESKRNFVTRDSCLPITLFLRLSFCFSLFSLPHSQFLSILIPKSLGTSFLSWEKSYCKEQMKVRCREEPLRRHDTSMKQQKLIHHRDKEKESCARKKSSMKRELRTRIRTWNRTRNRTHTKEDSWLTREWGFSLKEISSLSFLNEERKEGREKWNITVLLFSWLPPSLLPICILLYFTIVSKEKKFDEQNRIFAEMTSGKRIHSIQAFGILWEVKEWEKRERWGNCRRKQRR